MEELKAQDIEKLGVAEPQASEVGDRDPHVTADVGLQLHEEIRRRRVEDQKFVEEASKAVGYEGQARARC